LGGLVKAALIALAAFFLSAPAWAQMVSSGSFTPGHTVRCQNSTCTVVVDGGGAAGGNIPSQGYLTELGITNTGTPLCVNDALTSDPNGYHQLCFGANALGGGLIAYNAFAGANSLGLTIEINGADYPFPGAGGGNVLAPTSPTPTGGTVALWNGGTTLVTGPLPQTTIDGTVCALGGSCSPSVPISGLPALTAGHFFAGNASNRPVDVAVSGDVSCGTASATVPCTTVALQGRAVPSGPTTDGQILIGDSGTGNWHKSTLTVTPPLTITNAPGSITLAGGGGGGPVDASSNVFSGTITTTNTFQVLLAQNITRAGCTIQNRGANNIYISASSSPTLDNSLVVNPLGLYYCGGPGNVVITDALKITGTSGDAFAGAWQ